MLTDNYIESLLLVLYYCENLYWFFNCEILFYFLSFSLVFLFFIWYRLSSYSFLKMLLTFFQCSLYLLFIKKYTHLVLSKSPYIDKFLDKKDAQRSEFSGIFVTNEILKIFFTEANLIRCFYFINIYIVYQNRAIILVKLVFFYFSIIKL